MPYFDYEGEIDIDIDEFLGALNSKEINELIKALVDDGHLPKSTVKLKNNEYFPSERNFEEALDKLHGKCYQLTKEEEEIILKISNRF